MGRSSSGLCERATMMSVTDSVISTASRRFGDESNLADPAAYELNEDIHLVLHGQCFVDA
jgi:hypothetical protein